MKIRNTRVILLALGAAILVPSWVGAVDGVVEINQTCAMQTGCFAGDTAGFPVTITPAAGQSFRLTSDLVISVGPNPLIRVNASGVEIDLNGFTLMSADCQGATTDCTPTSSATTASNAVTAGFGFDNMVVRNGRVVGMWFDGIDLHENSRVEDVESRWNARYGIALGSNSECLRCVAFENQSTGIIVVGVDPKGGRVLQSSALGNGGGGIRVQDGGLVVDSTARDNTFDGISVGDDATVRGCTASTNGDDGIYGQDGSTIVDSSSAENVGDGFQVNGFGVVRGVSARLNDGVGIRAGAGSVVTQSSASQNGGAGIDVVSGSQVSDCSAVGNGDAGITAASGSNIQRCTMRSNGGRGLELSADVTYREVSISGNTLGTVIGGRNMFSNSCNGTTSCP